jgi:hypothetical protein
MAGREFGVDIGIRQTGSPRIGFQLGDGCRECAGADARTQYAGHQTANRLAVPGMASAVATSAATGIVTSMVWVIGGLLNGYAEDYPGRADMARQ